MRESLRVCQILSPSFFHDHLEPYEIGRQRYYHIESILLRFHHPRMTLPDVLLEIIAFLDTAYSAIIFAMKFYPFDPPTQHHHVLIFLILLQGLLSLI